MPRIKRQLNGFTAVRHPELLAALAAELKGDRVCGQPLVDEQHFPRTNAVSVNVIWDAWEPVRDEDRTALILQAYDQAEGKEFHDRIALALGLTFPEAYQAGLLPVQVLPVLRPGDPVTVEQCHQAMTDLGASRLFDPERPTLLFTTEVEARACVECLVKQLPASAPIWTISKEAVRLNA